MQAGRNQSLVHKHGSSLIHTHTDLVGTTHGGLTVDRLCLRCSEGKMAGGMLLQNRRGVSVCERESRQRTDDDRHNSQRGREYCRGELNKLRSNTRTRM